MVIWFKQKVMRLFKALGDLLSGSKSTAVPQKKEIIHEEVTTDYSKEIISIQQVATSSIPNKDTTPHITLNALEIREKIKKGSLDSLDFLYLNSPDSCASKHLVIWIDADSTTFKSLLGIEQELSLFWETERGYVFNRVEPKQGNPEKEGIMVDTGIESLCVYIQEFAIDTVPITHINRKATISLLGRNGSLLKDIYVLSSDELQRQHRRYYNIGRGEYPDVDGGGYRQNHIAIDDVNNQEKNQYVSRSHARIGFSEIIGFFLQVEWGGSRLAGNRTRVFRGDKKIEVENVEVKVPLQDGDIIELGKSVSLQFKEIEQ